MLLEVKQKVIYAYDVKLTPCIQTSLAGFDPGSKNKHPLSHHKSLPRQKPLPNLLRLILRVRISPNSLTFMSLVDLFTPKVEVKPQTDQDFLDDLLG